MCTGVRFVDNNNNLYFGRNLDVEQSYGEKVMVTPRNYHIPMKHVEDITTSKAFMGMGITAGDYPLYFDVANENGLAVANLNFPTQKIDGKIVEGLELFHYDKEVAEGKTNVTSYEFMVWILENFDTVEQIKAFDLEKNLHFVDTPLNEQMGTAPAHWLISDEKASIVVEPMRAGVKVYDNPVGVLTNGPTFDWHLTNLNVYLGLTSESRKPVMWGEKQLHYIGVGNGTFGMPGDWNPTSRFVKVAFVNSFFPTQEGEAANVRRLLQTLRSVAMPLGVVDEESTIYSSCYSHATQTYYYDSVHDFKVHSHTMTEAEKTASSITLFD